MAHYTRALLEVAPGERVYTGLGAFTNGPGALAEQIGAARAAGAGGQVLFSATDLGADHVRALAGSGGPWARPASAPAAGHLPLQPLARPPRPVPLVTLGTLTAGPAGSEPVSLSRDFYVRRGRTWLQIVQEGNSPLSDIQLVINGQAVSVPAGTARLEISTYVNPATTRVYTDPHTSTITIRGRGEQGARATFRIEDAY